LFEDGRVLKCANYLKELAFYRAIEGGEARTVKEHGLAPRFYGTVQRDGKEYFVMEDVGAGFVRPCVLDLKMGARTWHAECTMEKQKAHMEQDYSCTTHKYCFRFAGMKTYDAAGNVVRWPRKHAWYALDDNKMLAALSGFLDCAGSDARKAETICVFQQRIQHVLSFFRNEGGWELIASSLLFMYDADTTSTKPPVVYMIDFAHTTKLLPGSFDGGYMCGCKELLRFFGMMLEAIAKATPPPPATTTPVTTVMSATDPSSPSFATKEH